MDLVVDANILFAALIRDGLTIELMLDEKIHLFAPEFVLEEFYNNMLEILDKTHHTEPEFQEIFQYLQMIITIFSTEEYTDYLQEAGQILADHPKDIPYFALALKLNCAVWSNEKKLKGRKVTVYSTSDIVRLLRRQ